MEVLESEVSHHVAVHSPLKSPQLLEQAVFQSSPEVAGATECSCWPFKVALNPVMLALTINHLTKENLSVEPRFSSGEKVLTNLDI